MGKLGGGYDLLRATVREWRDDRASRLAAALSYYTVFSLVPLLVIGLAAAGQVFGEEAATNQLVAQLRQIVGDTGARAVVAMIISLSRVELSPLGTVAGIGALVFGASHVFAELKDVLNTIWQVAQRPNAGWKRAVLNRLAAIAMVLGMGLLLVASLALAAALSAVDNLLGAWLAGLPYLFAVKAVNLIAGFGINTLLFAAIYKILPDTEIGWSDVWIGSAMTSALFTAGQFLIGTYFGSSRLAAALGPTGAIVIVLIWIYFSAQILFFGAELTWVYANRYGSRIVPDENAEPMTDDARARQGLAPPQPVEAPELVERERTV